MDWATRTAAIRDLQSHGYLAHADERQQVGYNALQMKIDRRFSNGLLVTNSYTLSKSMDYANENGGISTPIDFNTAGRARTSIARTTT